MREGVSLSLPVNLFICSASSFLFKMSFIFHGRLPFCLLALAFVVVQTRLAAKQSKGRHHSVLSSILRRRMCGKYSSISGIGMAGPLSGNFGFLYVFVFQSKVN